MIENAIPSLSKLPSTERLNAEPVISDSEPLPTFTFKLSSVSVTVKACNSESKAILFFLIVRLWLEPAH